MSGYIGIHSNHTGCDSYFSTISYPSYCLNLHGGSTSSYFLYLGDDYDNDVEIFGASKPKNGSIITMELCLKPNRNESSLTFYIDQKTRAKITKIVQKKNVIYKMAASCHKDGDCFEIINFEYELF